MRRSRLRHLAAVGLFVLAVGCGTSHGGGAHDGPSQGGESSGVEVSQSGSSSATGSGNSGSSGSASSDAGGAGSSSDSGGTGSSASASSSSASEGSHTPGGGNGSSSGNGGGGASRRCGITPPTGTTDGRRTQSVVFPPPGTDHTYPHTSTTLRGCATSGLPVRYELDENSGCQLTSANGVYTVSIGFSTTGDCTILAFQDGDATWSPAGPVRGEFTVGYQPISVLWADPLRPMHYPSDPVPVRIRIESPDPFTGGMLSMTAEGSCELVDTGPFIDVNTAVVTVPVQPTKPAGPTGDCKLNGSVGSDHIAKSVTLPERDYTVIAS